MWLVHRLDSNGAGGLVNVYGQRGVKVSLHLQDLFVVRCCELLRRMIDHYFV